MNQPTHYDRLITVIQEQVTRIEGATFGYIGNCEMRPNGDYRFDDRAWSVFLPHPGRVGTYDDRIGSFATGNVEGAQECYRELEAFVRGIKFAHTIKREET